MCEGGGAGKGREEEGGEGGRQGKTTLLSRLQTAADIKVSSYT